MVMPEAVEVAAGKEGTTMFNDRIRRLGAVVVLALGLAACGVAGGTGEDDVDGVASLGTDTTTTAGGDTTDTSANVEAPTDPNEAYLLYDQCMAKEGFATDLAGEAGVGGTDVESVEGSGSDGGGGPTERMVGPGGVEIAPEDQEAFQAADEACRAHLANISLGEEFTPEQQAAMEDAALRVEQCMRDKGFDGLQFEVGGGEQGLTRQEEADEDPSPPQRPADPEALDEALKECSKIFEEYPELTDVLPPAPGS